MSQLTFKFPDGNEASFEEGTILYDILKDHVTKEKSLSLGKLNGKYYELSIEVFEGGNVEPVYSDTDIGLRVKSRTLQFILINAVKDIFPELEITIEHSLSKGIFGELKDKKGDNFYLSSSEIEKIKKRIKELIKSDLKIKKVTMTRQEAIEIFTNYGMSDKVKLLNQLESEKVKLYKLDGRYDYFYGAMAYSTGIIQLFDLVKYASGFLLRFPVGGEWNKLPSLVSHKKLSKIFLETEKWGNILEIPDVAALNEKVINGDIRDIIRVNEALHEKKIAYIADMISKKKGIKVVLIAGPSSSGKTTFARRLSIQLRVNGMIPIPISLDDYFVNREATPKDENGEYDFESIYALDLELFNENLTDLLDGKEVAIPSFNFKTGSREWVSNTLRLPSNGILIIEGIHGLNEMLTSSISKENKFKIYISALTQLNIDSHNRISTTDVRIIRRIVRDFLSRGYGGEQTLKMWPSIKRGEEKNIFVFQEEADVMFNSNLVYELCVLKKYAILELQKIDSSSQVYYEALRLKSFLHFFKEVDATLVPDNSILREFIGGSYFYKY